MIEHAYLTLTEAVAIGLKQGNDALLPFDFITSIGRTFNTPLFAIEGFDIELENGEYKSIRIDFKVGEDI